jgi:uncharacterized membrane protein
VIALTTIAHGDASRIVDSRRVVVRTPEEWRVLWALHAGPDAEAPAIDFASTIVAAAFAGEKPTAGHGIEIVAAIDEPDGVRLVLEQRAPGPGMLAAQILTSPFHIVACPRTDREVRWSGSGVRNAESGMRDAGSGTRNPESTSASFVTSSDSASRVPHAGATTSTGLSPSAASVLAYLAGPFSGALMLFAEPSNPDVRFHAWQSIIALGGLGLALVASYMLAFAALFVSATGVSLLVRVSTAIWLALLVVWAICLWKAVSGERWKLPLAGEYAERMATSTRPTPARQAPPTS